MLIFKFYGDLAPGTRGILQKARDDSAGLGATHQCPVAGAYLIDASYEGDGLGAGDLENGLIEFFAHDRGIK